MPLTIITLSIVIRMGGKNKKLKAGGKNRGKGMRVANDSRSPSPLCQEAVEELLQSPR